MQFENIRCFFFVTYIDSSYHIERGFYSDRVYESEDEGGHECLDARGSRESDDHCQGH